MLLSACGGGASSSDSSSGTPSSTGGGDTGAPRITITDPTSSSSYTAGSASLSLSGTASDDVGVAEVTWTNNRGGSGTAAGTTNWSISGITLQTGTNVITVTARDAAGNTGTDTLTVTYSGANVAFTLEVSWPPNPDDPDGYNVYVGPTATTVDSLASTLLKGSPLWDPALPAVQIPSDTVLAATGASSQVCVRIRAFNGAGLSDPSSSACVDLPPL